jgi:hypothetical protein
MSTGPASREALWKLHQLVTKCLTEYLTTTPLNKLRATFLHVVITFLNHNGITLATQTPDAAAEGLATLPFTKQ